MKVTDEMVAAFRDTSDNCRSDCCVRLGLDAVAAMVEEHVRAQLAAQLRALPKRGGVAWMLRHQLGQGAGISRTLLAVAHDIDADGPGLIEVAS